MNSGISYRRHRQLWIFCVWVLPHLSISDCIYLFISTIKTAVKKTWKARQESIASRAAAIKTMQIERVVTDGRLRRLSSTIDKNKVTKKTLKKKKKSLKNPRRWLSFTGEQQGKGVPKTFPSQIQQNPTFSHKHTHTHIIITEDRIKENKAEQNQITMHGNNTKKEIHGNAAGCMVWVCVGVCVCPWLMRDVIDELGHVTERHKAADEGANYSTRLCGSPAFWGLLVLARARQHWAATLCSVATLLLIFHLRDIYSLDCVSSLTCSLPGSVSAASLISLLFDSSFIGYFSIVFCVCVCLSRQCVFFLHLFDSVSFSLIWSVFHLV